MFFIMGITDGRKDFSFNQLVTCAICGKYGRFNVFMTYTVLSLFFIPTLKWIEEGWDKENNCVTDEYKYYDKVLIKDHAGNTLSEEVGSIYQASDGTYWLA